MIQAEMMLMTPPTDNAKNDTTDTNKDDAIDIDDCYDATDNGEEDGTDKDTDNAIDMNDDDATDNTDDDDNQIRRIRLVK